LLEGEIMTTKNKNLTPFQKQYLAEFSKQVKGNKKKINQFKKSLKNFKNGDVTVNIEKSADENFPLQFSITSISSSRTQFKIMDALEKINPEKAKIKEITSYPSGLPIGLKKLTLKFKKFNQIKPVTDAIDDNFIKAKVDGELLPKEVSYFKKKARLLLK